MKIVVESGTHLLNHGDNAMLVAAMQHVHRLWPDAHVQVVTAAPGRLATLLPNAEPLTNDDRWIWERHLLTWLRRRYAWIPSRQWLQGLERRVQLHVPMAARLLIHGPTSTEMAARAIAFGEAIAQTDLVLGSGGGGITDAFPVYASTFLSMIHDAQQTGAITACMGQGIGPLEQTRRAVLARRVLPRVDLIGVREGLRSPEILRSWGVPADRILVTGDDAIGLAYNARQPEFGNGIGVNLRAADYSGVGKREAELVREALSQLPAPLNGQLIPVPIERGTDEEALRPVMSLTDRPDDVGADLVTLPDLLRQITRCRVVVTGSYHAAVFALAQGIPAVGLARTPYYQYKFHGLAFQFGSGCEVVEFADAHFCERLQASIIHLWSAAESLRPALLEAARTQMAAVTHAYDQVDHIVQHGKARTHASA
jgi:polysaccharide pyruvyl transferase WcaK-like protein